MTLSTTISADASAPATWLDWGVNSLGHLGRQVADGLDELGESFGSLLSTAVAEERGDVAASAPLPTSTSVAGLESGLLSSLGLSSAGSGGALGVMQQNLLSALKTSLVTSQSQPEAAEPPPSPTLTESVMDYSFGEDGIGLTDAFDTFNVLNHVPVVSAVYQSETGTEINAVAKLAGGYFYGGPLGLTLSAVDLGVQALSGSSFNERLVSLDVNGLFGWGASIEDAAPAGDSGPTRHRFTR